jgi:hypothetical protein
LLPSNLETISKKSGSIATSNIRGGSLDKISKASLMMDSVLGKKLKLGETPRGQENQSIMNDFLNINTKSDLLLPKTTLSKSLLLDKA